MTQSQRAAVAVEQASINFYKHGGNRRKESFKIENSTLKDVATANRVDRQMIAWAKAVWDAAETSRGGPTGPFTLPRVKPVASCDRFMWPSAPAKDAARRYSPGYVVGVNRARKAGRPKRAHISTSHVERSNLTLRMQQRRFTRLTNGFSKKLENHEAAVSLFVAHYNFCRVHEALRMTPAMALNVADHIWTIGELVEAATGAVEIEPPPGSPVGRFRVIDGGLS